ncbi:GyrI-like domain-containing protein [Oceanirhabdus sp. W0125-5]|uniref:GyrI-like domain-containing protein n=1 Tax=Oceanirhabdus sp. W0125-5 TaxID=2999116 RepID=UPI0022F31764|nr:GyrI-like domain-containing protein [Oceanirhabdus sp. W0125-5]WBW94998.1 GyrI-like domain-containing protein [Oceanirhabdus sp. W0125-5]
MKINSMFAEELRIITIPEMRVAVCNIVSEAPEEDALNIVLEWAESEKIMGTARIFGFNTSPYSKESNEYGWAACVTIPEDIDLPEYLEEKRMSGGLYASLSCVNEIYDSWQKVMKLLKENTEYVFDETRLGLEEHISKGGIKGNREFYINLLEPVKEIGN